MRQEETAANQNERDIILDSLNEGVFTVDSDWRITSFNLAAERITGVPSEEALGKACSDVFHADICDCLLYTSDAADDLLCVDLGGRRLIKKKKTKSPQPL